MPDFDPRLKEIFTDKPECVIDLPEWLLPSQKINAYRDMSGLAIVEIAGRDSIAAAVKSVEEEGFTDLLPTYVYTGTEHGLWANVEQAVERLAAQLPGVRVHDLINLGSPGFWHALNGRFVSELISRYGFYTPCVGCHLYLHSVRIPLSMTLGKVPIVAGEREHHDGTTKVNQIKEALDVYQGIAKGFGVSLVLPLRHVGEGDRITDILGFEWKAGEEQLGCVLSGNYRTLDGTVQNTAAQVQRYLEEFAGPCAKKILEAYITGDTPNHLQMAASVLHY
ncbi:MAG: hypothetical protein JRJ47_00115 [Deltaproteobacteria bacterium]|nr:hypothetical protein [Deltaproteobacteria bacterium]